MNITDQFAGFLQSNSLWTQKELFDIPIFNFKNLNPSTIVSNQVDISVQENQVLGKRAEFFFKQCIHSTSRYKLIASNIQIFRNKITIGELDYIVEDLKTKEIFHIELVYKFYVYDPRFKEELYRWIGPNRKDSLLEKIQKLKKKQLPLLYQKETRDVLENLSLDSGQIQQKVCYLAQLFTPFSFNKKATPYFNDNCFVGFWMNFQDFLLNHRDSSLYFLPEKKNWSVHPSHNTIWLTCHEIIPLIESKLFQKKSPLLWKKDSEDSYSKFFVVWW